MTSILSFSLLAVTNKYILVVHRFLGYRFMKGLEETALCEMISLIN